MVLRYRTGTVHTNNGINKNPHQAIITLPPIWRKVRERDGRPPPLLSPPLGSLSAPRPGCSNLAGERKDRQGVELGKVQTCDWKAAAVVAQTRITSLSLVHSGPPQPRRTERRVELEPPSRFCPRAGLSTFVPLGCREQRVLPLPGLPPFPDLLFWTGNYFFCAISPAACECDKSPPVSSLCFSNPGVSLMFPGEAFLGIPPPVSGRHQRRNTCWR